MMAKGEARTLIRLQRKPLTADKGCRNLWSSPRGHTIWTTENGLPQNSIRAIAQTAHGFLWLATMAGLVRFDGAQFRVFNLANSPAPGDEHITALAAGPGSTLWLGTSLAVRCCGNAVDRNRWRVGQISQWRIDHGISRCRSRHGSRFARVSERDDLGRNQRRPEEDCHGAITTYTKDDGLAGNSVWAMARTADGTLWIATRPGGLSAWCDSRFRNYTPRDGLTHDGLVALLVDP